MGAHTEILQVSGEAYFSWSEKIVNDCNHEAEFFTRACGQKCIDTKESFVSGSVGRKLWASVVEKLRMEVDIPVSVQRPGWRTDQCVPNRTDTSFDTPGSCIVTP